MKVNGYDAVKEILKGEYEWETEISNRTFVARLNDEKKEVQIQAKSSFMSWPSHEGRGLPIGLLNWTRGESLMKESDSTICPACNQEFTDRWERYAEFGIMPGKIKCEKCGEIFMLVRPVHVMRKSDPLMDMLQNQSIYFSDS